MSFTHFVREKYALQSVCAYCGMRGEERRGEERGRAREKGEMDGKCETANLRGRGGRKEGRKEGRAERGAGSAWVISSTLTHEIPLQTARPRRLHHATLAQTAYNSHLDEERISRTSVNNLIHFLYKKVGKDSLTKDDGRRSSLLIT